MGRPRRDLVLFVDVNFWDDPKIQQLTVHDQMHWLRLLAEQLRYGRGAELPTGHWGTSRERLGKYIELGLLIDVDGRLHINAWEDWNGREAYKRFLARERKRRQRNREPGSAGSRPGPRNVFPFPKPNHGELSR